MKSSQSETKTQMNIEELPQEQNNLEQSLLSQMMKYKSLAFAGVFVFICFGFFAISSLNAHHAQAAGTCTAKASADWTASTTWTLTSGTGCAVTGGPVAGDTVVIPSGFTVTISTAVAASSISMSSASVANGINMTGGSLTVSGAVTMSGSGTNGITQSFAINAATATVGSISITAGNSTKVTQVTLSTGSLTTGSITFAGTAGNAKFTTTGAATIHLVAATIGSGGTVSIATGTNIINDSGSSNTGYAITTTGACTVTAGTLTLGAATSCGTVTVGNGATLAASTFLLTITGTGAGVLTCGSGGSATISGSGGITLNGASPTITSTGTCNVTNSGTFTVSGATAPNIASGSTYVFSGAFASTNVTNNGTVSIAGTLSGTTWTQANGSTLNITGTTTPTVTTLAATTNSNTVSYKNTVTMKATTYYNLDITAGAGTVTSAAVTVNNNLTVTSGTLSLVGSAFTVTGTTSVTGTINTATAATGTKTFTGAVTVNSGGVFDLSSVNPVNSFGAGITQNSSTATSFKTGSGGTTLVGNLAGTGTGNMNFGGALTVSSGTTTNNYTGGSVIISGTLTLTGNWVQGSNSTTQVGTISGAGTIDASTNVNTWQSTATIYDPTAGSTPHKYYNLTPSGTVTISSGVTGTLGDFTMTGGSTLTTTNNFTVGGNLTLNNGQPTLTIGAFTFTVSGTVTIGDTSGTFISTLNATNATAITFNGSSVTINVKGAYTKQSSGNLTFNSGGATSLTDSTSGLQDLGNVVIGNSSNATNLAFSSSIKMTSVNITTGATLNINGTRTLTLTGSGTPITRAGTFTASTGTVTYISGSGVTALSSAAMTGSNKFNNLNINGAGTFNAGVNITVNSTLNIVAGTLDLGSTTLTFLASNPLSISGTFTANTSTIVYSSNSALVAAMTYYNLTLNGFGTDVLPNSDWAVQGNLTIQSSITKGTGVLTFSGTTATTVDYSYSFENIGAVVIGKTSGTPSNNKVTLNSSLVVDTLTINANNTLDLGNIGNTLDLVLAGNSASDIAVLTVSGTLTVNTNSYVEYDATNAGAGKISVATTPYNNLAFGGLGTYKLTGNLTGVNAITGGLSIFSGSILDTVSGSNYNMEIGGNFSNGGTFTARNSTVSFIDNTQTSQISGSVSFYSLTVATAAKHIQFTSGQTFAVSGVLTLTGTSGNQVTLNSINGTADWTINFTGTSSVTYTTVTHSACTSSSPTINMGGAGDTNGGSLGACWLFPSPVNISGVLYVSGGSTPEGTSQTLRWSKNGAASSTISTTASTGAYTFSSLASDGDVFTIWIDGGSLFGTTVVKYGSTFCTPNCTNLKVVEGEIDLYTKNASAITYADLKPCDNDAGAGCATTNIGFNVDNSTNAITVNSARTLYIVGGFDGSGLNFTPGVPVTGGSLTIASREGGGGTVTMGTNNLTLSGDFFSLGYLSTSTGQTTTFTATTTGHQVTQDAGSFYNLVFNGVGGAWTLGHFGLFQVDNSISVTNGSISSSVDITVTGGVTGTGTVNFTAGTLALSGTGNFGGGSAMNFNNVTFSGGTHTLTGTTTYINGNLTINNGATVTKGSGTLVLSNSTITDNNGTKQDLGNIRVSGWCDISSTACDSTWMNRRRIFFDNTASSTNLTNFPLLVAIPYSGFDYTKTQNSGQDIRFVDADGVTALSYEIEQWNEFGTSYVWVKVPQLDNTNSDFIYMYYNNPSAADNQTPSTVWDSNFKGVWHLPNGTTLTANDSTSYGKNGTLNGSPTATSGQIGGGANFNGSTSYISATPAIGSTMTFSAWATWNGTGNPMLFALASGPPGPDLFFIGGTIYWNTYDGTGNPIASIPASASDGNYHNYTMVVQSGNTKLYYDGALIGSATYHDPTTNLLQIGGNTGGYIWGGKIDEVRISDIARSADWIKAQYQSMNGTMNTIGAEEKGRINVALQANGGVASASSTHVSGAYPVASVNDGIRVTGGSYNWGINEGWNDNTNASWPDTLDITFNGTYSVSEIDVVTLQDGFNLNVTPSLTDTFSSYGITNFLVQYWNGSSWVTLSTVTSNNKVWRQFTFSPVTTTKVRLSISGSADGSASRVVEFEAWGNKVNLGSSVKATALTVDAGGGIDFESNTLTLTDTTAPLTLNNNATFAPSNGTIDFTGNGVTIPCNGITYYNVGLKPSSTSAQTICPSASLGGNWTTLTSPNFINPDSVALDPVNNKVYVGDGDGQMIHRFDSGGGGTTFGANWQSINTSSIDSYLPGRMSIDSVNNKLYLTDPDNGRIASMDSGAGTTTFGANVQYFGSYGSSTGQFQDGEGIYVDSTYNKVYVVDGINNRVASFDSGSGGTHLGDSWQTFGTTGSGTNQFNSPLPVVADSTNNKVYIGDFNNHRIVSIDSGTGGTTLGGNWATFGTTGSGTNQFGNISGLAVDASHNKLYVSDNNNRIATFDSGTGTTTLGGNWATFGTTGSGTNQLLSVLAVSVNPATNKLFVMDAGNARVVKFDSGSNTLSVSNTLTIGDGSHNGASAATNNPVISAANVVINSGATFTAPSSTLSITGDFTNSGTFTHNSGTVIFAPSSGTSNLLGSSATTFNNLKDLTNGSTLKFKSGVNYTFSGTLTVSAAASNPVILQSDSSGQQWTVTFSVLPSLTNVKVQDGACNGGLTISNTHNLYNLGNNGFCWGFGTFSIGGGSGASGGGAGGGGHSSGGGLPSAGAGQLTSGPLSGSIFNGQGNYTGETIEITGGNPWSNESNIASSDNSYATAYTNPGFCSRFGCTDPTYPFPLLVTGFGFNIPAESTINAVVVQAEGHDDPGSTNSDIGYLVKNNIVQNNHEAALEDSGFQFGQGDAVITFGDGTNWYGAGITPADVNNSGFGIALVFYPVSDSILYIDQVTMTIYYTPAPSGGSGGSSGGGGGNGGGGGGSP